MTTEVKNIRWSVVVLLAALLSLAVAAMIWGPMLLHQRQMAVKAAEASRPTLQTYVEGGNSSYADDKAKDVLPLLPYESISLERTGCLGDCPVYIATFYKDGHATLVTNNWRDKGKRKYTSTIWIGSYVRLTQLVALAKSAARQTEYSGEWTDDSTAIIRVRSNDQTWQVSDYGRVAPVEVWALELLLHDFREQIEWVPAGKAGA